VSPFVLYVEGPRDREILQHWARRTDPELGRCLERSTVILGGRQPRRAVADFRKRGGRGAGLSGVIVLDRDDHVRSTAAPEEPGLEVFIWTLRHIESYLLVPDAIGRLLGLGDEDRRVERFVAEHGCDSLDAKRILAAGGPLTEMLGVELRAGDIARAMRVEDLHGDILELFSKIGSYLGHASRHPEVVVRPRP